MRQKSISGRAISNAITSEDVLGKDVIDSEGAFIGVVEKIFIDPKILEFTGISVDKGLIKSGLIIGKSYIDKIEEYAVFLKIKVVYDVKGKFVFDKNGKKVGVVSSIDLYGGKNKIKNLYVRPPFFPFKEKIVISSNYIATMGDNVLLNITLDDLQKETPVSKAE